MPLNSSHILCIDCVAFIWWLSLKMSSQIDEIIHKKEKEKL